ncbi:GNAT family N-acetyltransferase [Streptomyces sp. SID5785]|uniref:GNAT family N-acetyltransferase n=1 Tax=Streptomyces sp. SID5785 TaxID=2690309 RepID=UPI00136118C6|nr:GNAT family N-acetyltransferase [Streptomyces sp. SID5785]MZD09438.1 GNAT family N-acetyltransferase [Streptomyces sp. SID5785]
MTLHTITTARLTLHEISREAAADLNSGGGDGGFPWLGGGPADGTRIGSGITVKAWDEDAYRSGWGTYVLVRGADGHALGGIGFHSPPDAEGAVEIGYDLVPEARGAGYATEAVCALTAWALGQDGVGTVLAHTDPDNAASQRVLARAGFRRAAGDPGQDEYRFVHHG